MAFTMHSHSGQFCPGHARDDLEDIVRHAISVGIKTMALTEHMPRTELSDLYPEELTPDPHASLAALGPRHKAFLIEAQRLQRQYADRIHILIGFEGEWIRPSSAAQVAALLEPPCVDLHVGSVHHGAAGVPIDFDLPAYRRAVVAAGGSEPALYASYYDAQLEMLRLTRPRIVGHFDLVRLMSADPDRSLRRWEADDGGNVWQRVVRNLEFVVGYGGWLECNTSALRKGLAEPYPGREIAEEYLRLGGKFTFSDDSHGIAQVATNFHRGLDYLESLGVKEVWTLERRVHPGTPDGTKSPLVEKSVPLPEFRATLKTKP